MATHLSLPSSLATQARVIGALLMREVLTRYGRHNIGFMWLFLEPMIFTLGVTALWTATKNAHGSNLAIVPFAVTGYSSVLMWRNAVSQCTKAIQPNLALLYHRNVAVIDLFAARLLLEISGATISLLVLSTIFIATGWMKVPADVFKMVGAWLLLAWFAVSLGLIIGALTERSEMFARFWHTVTYLIFPFSGAIFMVDWLPKPAQDLVLWLPMVHAVEMLRDGYFGPVVRTHYNVPYLMTVNLVMLLVGLILVHKTKQLVGSE
jgi:capsular polysaccharide transport system permease protein